jgi:hypothetical protein
LYIVQSFSVLSSCTSVAVQVFFHWLSLRPLRLEGLGLDLAPNAVVAESMNWGMSVSTVNWQVLMNSLAIL